MTEAAPVFGRLHPLLREAIVHRLGWQSLRPVQDLAGHALLDGHNAVVLAPTAGGKTEAAFFPALSLLLDAPRPGVGVLYVAPIKALLNNQAERLERYAEMVGLRRFVWHGDVSSHARRVFLRAPAEVLLTTPESLEVMLISPSVDTHRLFANLRLVVVDEIHALAGTDRGAHLLSVIERLVAPRASADEPLAGPPHDVQRVGLSATVGNPERIVAWLAGSSKRPGTVVAPPNAPQRRQLAIHHADDPDAMAEEAAGLARGLKSLFFCHSRKTTEAVARALQRLGTPALVHHSSVSASERQAAEARFAAADQEVCIVCTSTLELGIDVGDLDRVLQHNTPTTVSSFLQRMGRTGRRPGSTANTVFLCEEIEAVWTALGVLDCARAGWVESVEINDRCWPVVVHQILAMTLAAQGVTVTQLWAHLHRLPDACGIDRAAFDHLLSWMRSGDWVEEVGGRLVLGRESEKRFGRRHFMELYAVFSSPAHYEVLQRSGAPLGSIEQDFADKLIAQETVFRLSGRGWQVFDVDHRRRRVEVVPAPGGKPPTWNGWGGGLLSEPIAAAVRRVLERDDRPPVLSSSAWEVLHESRLEMAEVFANGDRQWGPKGLTWWTFAGGRINSTLAWAFRSADPGIKVVAHDFWLRFEGESLTDARHLAARARLTEPGFWRDEQRWTEVARALPLHRLSKFQPLMPPDLQRELVARHLLDLPAAEAWLAAHQR